jgi:PAS domain S-box-containing protein
VARIGFDGRFLEANQRFCLITGYEAAELARLTAAEITAPDDLAWEDAEAAALIAGESQTYSLERRYIRKGGEPVWVNFTASLVRRPDGAPDYLVAVVEDISERKAAEAAAAAHEEHLRLLINELNHRVKNTLTTVQSMAVQTLRSAEDPAEAIERLENRILGLSAAHNILTARNWEGASLGELIERTILPFAMDAPDRVARTGRELWLKPQMAVALSIAFHELATNAVKYGALSTPQGRVDIGWTREADLLEIRWAESGGPPVEEPRRKGFGSRVIERSLPRELGAPATLRFEPEGLTCAIRAVLDR